MIIYGNHERPESASGIRDSVVSTLHLVAMMAPGIHRHASLVRAFIRAAELVQGLADADFYDLGYDARSPSQAAGAVLLLKMAQAVDRSWRSGFRAEVDVPTLLQPLWDVGCGGIVRTRVAEGYAHYALYPESYLEAARRSGLEANTSVIGIRSIGVGLGALVAAALEASPATTLRPVGHPFDRQIRAAPELIAAHAANPDVHFAVVDEGPGLSGSSFASVGKWLCSQGVATNRIHFFPSHDGAPGLAGTTDTRKMWNGVQRHPARLDDFLCHADGLRSWVEEQVGPLESFVDETSGPLCQKARHPHDARFARRKFLGQTSGVRWLVKFAGLADTGERKLHDAKALARAGMGPEVACLCHGFLVQRWTDGRPLDSFGLERGEFLLRLGSYLAFRASGLGFPTQGASLEALYEMAIHNTSRSLGTEAASMVRRRLAGLLDCRVHRIRTDNRLHAWEWLVTKRGILKVDAVDHCEGHDLIGCQDIAWDIAGSIVEHDLTADEIGYLCKRIGRNGGVEVEKTMIAAMLPCYLAFQLGLWSTATPSTSRTVNLSNLYAGKLSRCLNGHDSLIGS
jgi:hypothetical protein